MPENKISVVVPAYNLAEYLPRCLDSILAQSHRNLEVIVVDDGSQDDTYAVLQDYISRDSRVKAIYKENGGVTSARLRGIREASGKWIGFVDGDDEIEPQMYARLLEKAQSCGADISHCGYQRIFANGNIEYHYNTELCRRAHHPAERPARRKSGHIPVFAENDVAYGERPSAGDINTAAGIGRTVGDRS